jgi:hypothetical protein
MDFINVGPPPPKCNPSFSHPNFGAGFLVLGKPSIGAVIGIAEQTCDALVDGDLRM